MSTVYVVEDDEAIRLSVQAMLDSIRQPVQTFRDARSFLDFLEQAQELDGGCIVLDVRLPGMNGMELQRKLIDLSSILPVIFVTGHGDIPMAVEAMERGAIAFLTKPYREQELLDKIFKGLEICKVRHARRREFLAFREALQALTPREKEVLGKITEGKPSKVIAHELAISERTVEVHRSNLFRKLKTYSLADITHKFLSAARFTDSPMI